MDDHSTGKDWKAGSIDTACAAIRARGHSGRLARQSIADVIGAVREWVHVAHTIEERWFAYDLAPDRRLKKSVLQDVPPLAGNPWADGWVPPDAIPCLCPQCEGQKKVDCPTCEGSNRVQCRDCGGGGRVAGARGPRNCSRCRGTGSSTCSACPRGRVDCGACGGAGRGWVTLVIHKSRREERLIEGVAEGRPTAAPAPDPAGVLVVEDLVDPPDLAERHLPRLDPARARIVSSRRQHLVQHVHRVHFELPRLGRGFVDVEQPAGRVAGVDLAPLRRRRTVSIAAASVALASVLALSIASAAKGAWYREFGHPGYFTLVLAVGFLLALAAWLSSHYRRLNQAVPRAGASLALLAFFVAVAVWLLPQPSRALGLALAESGDLTRATLTARALAERGDHAGAEAVHDAIAMIGVRSGGLDDALGFLARPHQDSSYEAEAREAVHARAPVALRGALERCSQSELTSLADRLRSVEPALADQASDQAALCPVQNALRMANVLEAEAALSVLEQQRPGAPELQHFANPIAELAAARAGGLLDAAGRRDLAATEEVRLLKEAYPLVAIAHDRDADGSDLPVLERLDRRLARAVIRTEEEQAAAERARAAEARAAERARAAEARAAVRARARREREAQRAVRRRSTRQSSGRLRCRDGSLSPNCSCGGSHRGCCSSHGGVAGCG